MKPNPDFLLAHTAHIVASLVSHGTVKADDVPQLIASTFNALAGLAEEPAPEVPTYEPAVSIRSSVKPDHVVCLVCGAKSKMLKRHLHTAHGLDVDEYRARYGLSADHPLTAPNYSEKRRELAKSIGLGRKPGQKFPRKKAA